MKKTASPLEDDHVSLRQLLAGLEAELATNEFNNAYKALDFFWARLAVHIRAEHLHLFPALESAPAALFAKDNNLPTRNEAQNLIARLRSDHDFFMKELATMIKIMREIAERKRASPNEAEDLRERLAAITKRLEDHNQLEEKEAYLWPALLFDEPTVASLNERLQHELEKLPPRFA